ncbi:MAG: hypothetical protein KC609_05670 [Myxococcales bacterium]|nr:hypothetical protein [Myxococcales bacterium]
MERAGDPDFRGPIRVVVGRCLVVALLCYSSVACAGRRCADPKALGAPLDFQLCLLSPAVALRQKLALVGRLDQLASRPKSRWALDVLRQSAFASADALRRAVLESLVRHRVIRRDRLHLVPDPVRLLAELRRQLIASPAQLRHGRPVKTRDAPPCIVRHGGTSGSLVRCSAASLRRLAVIDCELVGTPSGFEIRCRTAVCGRLCHVFQLVSRLRVGAKVRAITSRLNSRGETGQCGHCQ